MAASSKYTLGQHGHQLDSLSLAALATVISAMDLSPILAAMTHLYVACS